MVIYQKLTAKLTELLDLTTKLTEMRARWTLVEDSKHLGTFQQFYTS